MNPPGGARHVRLAAFLVPPLAMTALLYRALSELQIALTHPETLIVAGLCLALALGAGAAAAFGGPLVRTIVLSATAVLLLDVTFHGPLYFDGLQPDVRRVRARDARRVRDLATIRTALEAYIASRGAPPAPAAYGEGVGPRAFWQNWWDLSAVDQSGDGRPFMGFLVSDGFLPAVPLDPVNRTDDPTDPRLGHQYVYYVTPPGYDYAGGSCRIDQGEGTYLLAITAFESPAAARPAGLRSPGCSCLWKDKPDFFGQYFDYVVCGSFPPSR
ncbi:MAG: hypothetical protein R2752_20545 [Vicinamibacterales bacterium]